MLRKFLTSILIILAVLSIYFGSYLPLAKSRRYIAAVEAFSSVRSIDDFKRNFDKALNFYSPVGQEEVVKFLSGNILNLISDENQPEVVSRFLVDYIEPRIFQNDVRHLLTIGNMYLALWARFNQKEDFNKAENYFRQAQNITPNLPLVLYGLFELYQAKGDKEKIQEIGQIILRHWPEDEKAGAIINSLQ